MTKYQQSDMPIDIKDRTLKFAVRVSCFVDVVPKRLQTVEYLRQLIRSSASVGANVEEADGALSKKDFICKMGIARREARETRYWLRLILEARLLVDLQHLKELEMLVRESGEIRLILSSIINNTKLRV